MRARAHVLVIAPLYPPTEGPVPAAANRSRGLVRALVELGYDVTVVCGMPRGTAPVPLPGVQTVEVPWLDLDSLAVARLQSRRPAAPLYARLASRARALGARLLPPDRYVTWIPGAALAARRALRDHSILLSTSAKSAHVVARLVAGSHRWIADLNDPWTGNAYMPSGPVRRRVEAALERTSLSAATDITTTSDGIGDLVAANYGAVRITTLLSGFDPEEFRLAAATTDVEPGTILCVGTVYPQYDLTPIYAALAEGKRRGTIDPGRIRFEFVGRLSQRILTEARARRVEEFFRISPPVDRRDVIARMTGAGALLLPLYERDTYSIPMKFFEYVGAGRPILALGPADRVPVRLVERHGLGVVITTAQDVLAVLERLSCDPEALRAPSREAASVFTWKATSATLAELLS